MNVSDLISYTGVGSAIAVFSEIFGDKSTLADTEGVSGADRLSVVCTWRTPGGAPMPEENRIREALQPLGDVYFPWYNTNTDSAEFAGTTYLIESTTFELEPRNGGDVGTLKSEIRKALGCYELAIMGEESTIPLPEGLKDTVEGIGNTEISLGRWVDAGFALSPGKVAIVTLIALGIGGLIAWRIAR